MNPPEGSAASNYPVVTQTELVAYFNSMRLAEASSLGQQQQGPPPPPPQQQRYATRTSDFSTSSTRWQYLLYQHQMEQQGQGWSPQHYQWGANSSSSGYGPEIGAAAYNPWCSAGSQPYMRTPSAGHYNPIAASRETEEQQLRMLSASQYQPAAAFIPAAPSPPVASYSTSQYNPIAASRVQEAQNLRTSQYNPIAAYHIQEAEQLRTLSASQYQPVASFFPPVAPSPSVVSSSTSQIYIPYHCSDDDRHMLALLRDTEPDLSELTAPTMGHGARTLEDIRLELLRGPMELPVALFSESSDHVVTLLNEGSDEIRLSVLAGVKTYVHRLIESKEGHKVFVALLSCCQERLQELYAIVEAAVMPIKNASTSSLLRSVKQDHGETCIKELISAVAPYPQFRRLITDCFVVERITEHPRGEQLLHHFFTRMPYNDSMVVVRYACRQIGYMLSSAFGSRCLAECFANAEGIELQYLEKCLEDHFHDIARGQYSNYFVQRVLECGRPEFKQRIVNLIVEDAVSLSQDQYGSYVVEASLRKTSQLQDLCTRHILWNFVHLPNDRLVELVQGKFSNFVVQKLLITGKDLYPTEALALARKIERLPPHTMAGMEANQVAKVIKRLFPRRRLMC